MLCVAEDMLCVAEDMLCVAEDSWYFTLIHRLLLIWKYFKFCKPHSLQKLSKV